MKIFIGNYTSMSSITVVLSVGQTAGFLDIQSADYNMKTLDCCDSFTLDELTCLTNNFSLKIE